MADVTESPDAPRPLDRMMPRPPQESPAPDDAVWAAGASHVARNAWQCLGEKLALDTAANRLAQGRLWHG